jgi:hypothetical protein
MKRVIPERQDQYFVAALDARRMGLIDNLLIGQIESYAVPFWPDARRVDATVSAGSNVVVNVDTVDRDFVVGGYAVLWQDEFTCEECLIAAKTDTSVTLTTVAGTYAAKVKLVPSRRGRLTSGPQTRRLTTNASEVQVTFDYEHGVDPGVDQVSTVPIFTVAAFNRDTDATDDLEYNKERIDNKTYTWQDYDLGTLPVGQKTTLPLFLDTREKVRELREWYFSLRGACKPFWLPTYQMDLMPVDAIITNVSSLTIHHINYTTRFFPHERFRHLAFVTHGNVITHSRVTAAVDNGDGTETLTLSTASGGAIHVSQGSGLVSYMMYCRLAQDSFQIIWDTPTYARAVLPIIELPRQTPTTT